MADRKGNRGKRKIKQKGNTSESVEIKKKTLGNKSGTKTYSEHSNDKIQKNHQQSGISAD